MKKIEDLIEKDGLYYEKGSDSPFNGEIKDLASGVFKNGLPDGNWKEYSDKGVILSESNYIEG